MNNIINERVERRQKAREAYIKKHDLIKFYECASGGDLDLVETGRATLMRAEKSDGTIADIIFLHDEKDCMHEMRAEKYVVEHLETDFYRIVYLTVLDIDTPVKKDALVLRTCFHAYPQYYSYYQHCLWHWDD